MKYARDAANVTRYMQEKAARKFVGGSDGIWPTYNSDGGTITCTLDHVGWHWTLDNAPASRPKIQRLIAERMERTLK